jgi:uncharacterized protein (DUF1501 family)
MLTRRNFIVGGGGGTFLALSGLPSVTWAASAGTNERLLVVLLRGGMDGLAAVPMLADPTLSKIRPSLNIRSALPLDGQFGLHPALKTLHALWSAQQLAVVHSTGIYTGRSHFEGQDVMQTGIVKPYASPTGWVGRGMRAAGLSSGVAISIPMPLILRGAPESSTEYPNWMAPSPVDFVQKLNKLWVNDDALSEFGQELLTLSQSANRRIGPMTRAEFTNELTPASLARIAAQQMSSDDGPRVGLIDIDRGFDTHSAQGADDGGNAQMLEKLDRLIASFRDQMGDLWRNVLVVTVTEFGRTAAENGSAGTDHGVGSCCFLAGGLVNRSRVYADWRGLGKKDLFEGRDLPPTIDVRAVYARAMERVFGLTTSQVQDGVLQFASHKALDGLLS